MPVVLTLLRTQAVAIAASLTPTLGGAAAKDAATLHARRDRVLRQVLHILDSAESSAGVRTLLDVVVSYVACAGDDIGGEARHDDPTRELTWLVDALDAAEAWRGVLGAAQAYIARMSANVFKGLLMSIVQASSVSLIVGSQPCVREALRIPALIGGAGSLRQRLRALSAPRVEDSLKGASTTTDDGADDCNVTTTAAAQALSQPRFPLSRIILDVALAFAESGLDLPTLASVAITAVTCLAAGRLNRAGVADLVDDALRFATRTYIGRALPPGDGGSGVAQWSLLAILVQSIAQPLRTPWPGRQLPSVLLLISKYRTHRMTVTPDFAVVTAPEVAAPLLGVGAAEGLRRFQARLSLLPVKMLRPPRRWTCE